MGLGHGTPVPSDLGARARLASAAQATGLLKATGFASAGLVRVSSRLCLSVEHGDYNGTDLFGIGLDRYLWLAFAPNELGIVRAFSADFAGEGLVTFDPARVPTSFEVRVSANDAVTEWQSAKISLSRCDM